MTDDVGARKAKNIVLRAIRNTPQLSKGWWVRSQIALPGKNSDKEIDLLIGIPGKGLVIVEVKGWTHFKRREVKGREVWSYEAFPPGCGKFIDRQSPYEQANGQKYALRDFLNEIRASGRTSLKGLPNYNHVVWFINMRRDYGLERIPSTYLPITLFSEDGTEHGLLKALGNLVRDGSSNPNNATSNLALVRDLFPEEFAVEDNYALLAESENQIRYVSNAAMRERAASFDGNRLYVRGAAGTGKTLYALSLARDRSVKGDRKSVYICYSNNLANELRQQFEGSETGVIILTPEQLVSRFGDRAKHDQVTRTLTRAIEDESRPLAAMGINVPVPTRHYLRHPSYHALIFQAIQNLGSDLAALLIDEAQDFSPQLIKALDQEINTGVLYAIFADPFQRTREAEIGYEWQEPTFTGGGKVESLTRNYRNGDKIVAKIEELCDVNYDDPVDPYPASVVRIFQYRNEAFQRGIVNCVSEVAFQDGKEPTILTIGVASPDFDFLKSTFNEVYEVDDFKGLERDSICLVIGSSPNPVYNLRDEHYVGLSRARVSLSIFSKYSELTK